MRPFIMVLSRALADGREHRSAIGPNALGAVRGSCRGAAGKLKGERHCTERQDPTEGKDVHVGKDLCLPLKDPVERPVAGLLSPVRRMTARVLLQRDRIPLIERTHVRSQVPILACVFSTTNAVAAERPIDPETLRAIVKRRRSPLSSRLMFA
jgi:hypothetical protein